MMSNLEKLVYMANQIARNIPAKDRDCAVAATAEHLERFWNPRMKQQIIALLGEKNGLSDVALDAVVALRNRSARTGDESAGADRA